MYKKISAACLSLVFVIFCPVVLAENFPAALFPLDNYQQDVDAWLSPQDPQYSKSLLTPAYQKERLKVFHQHLFSTSSDAASPWSKGFVSQVLNKNPGVLASVKDSLMEYSNQSKSEKNIGCGENFRPHEPTWITAIAGNIDLKQFILPIKYKSENRAIVVKNTYARMLPTRDPHFYSYEIPGQGYPFDNLQASALWAGTPVYIIGKTKDGAWSLVMAPSFIAWIESDTIANASSLFVQRWEKFAKSDLAAVIHTESPITDTYNKKYQLTAYVGSVFPLLKEGSKDWKIWIPLRDVDGNAYIREALIDKKYAARMPLAATPENFSILIKTLQNRPYGWGNSYFYNDCSAELQNLYTPFGIWLPRNSSKQSMSGKMVDLGVSSAEKRLSYLMQNGHPLTTIVYIGGHVFMYLGNYPNPHSADHALMAMSYQNVWGLTPKDGRRRAVIGQSVLLPLLTSYPEDPALNPLINTKRFQVIDLDQWSDVEHKVTDLFF